MRGRCHPRQKYFFFNYFLATESKKRSHSRTATLSSKIRFCRLRMDSLMNMLSDEFEATFIAADTNSSSVVVIKLAMTFDLLLSSSVSASLSPSSDRDICFSKPYVSFPAKNGEGSVTMGVPNANACSEEMPPPNGKVTITNSRFLYPQKF